MLNVKKAFSSVFTSVQKNFYGWKTKHQGILNIPSLNSSPYCTKTECHSNSLQVKELEIPVPFGTIRAKAWGSEAGYPVLAFHGWLDNCGTFDRLIPMLSDKFYFVTIDAPGHGLSSYKPPGVMYTNIGMVRDFRRVSDYFGWEKFHVMGHSLGGELALFFSAFFPELVDKVISLDTVMPFCIIADNVPPLKIKAITTLIDIEKKLQKPAPVYSHESAPARLTKGMHYEITEDLAEILLKRGAKTSDCGKGLVFTPDLRCKPIAYISVECDAVMYHLMSTLKCDLLMILANNTNPAYLNRTPESTKKFTDLYKKTLTNFVLEHVEGNHFVHLNHPERIAPIINKFLSNEG